MAEFSKEYADIQNMEDFDFSYAELLEELENGEYQAAICEGLGIFSVLKENDIRYLVVTYDGDLPEYSSYLNVLKNG